jgi:superfamily I DNA/RNA helicase
LKKDLDYVCTIHGLAKRLTGIPHDAVWGLDSHLEEMRVAGFEMVGRLALDTFQAEKHTSWDAACKAWDVLRNQCLSIEQGAGQFNQDNVKFHLDRLSAFVDAYEGVKKSQGAKDFTDMLADYVQGEWGKPPIEVLFLDEAQDYSKLQWQLIDKLIASGLKRVYIAGDDDQAVFTFTGSDEYGFLDFPCDTEEILEHSYRVPKTIGSVAERLLGRLKRRKAKGIQWADREGIYRPFGDTWDGLPLAEWARQDTSTMIIARHRYGLARVGNALNEIGVPYTTSGKWERDSLVPKAIAYHDLKAGRRISRNEAATLMRWFGDRKASARLYKRDKKDTFGASDLPPLNYNCDWIKYLAKDEKHEAILSEARGILKRHGIDILRKRPAIDLSTFHASKGRESDRTVLLPDCSTTVYNEQERKPDSEIRLAYVGLTRAKRECIVTLPRTRRFMIGVGA